MTKILAAAVATAALVVVSGSRPAAAQSVGVHADLHIQAGDVPEAGPEYAYAPVPPHVETAPVAVNQGAYCYAGPHPVDTRVAAGQPWDETHGQHTHFYPPFDLRLFALKDGCYHFIGDPRDFGYRGQVHSYYGAHPILDDHGGGWCFMIGGHGHWWRPWSPHFVVMGPWYYWHGPYDPFFHSYWPYYAVYYRSHYPRYYRGGRFHRGRAGGWAVAPPVGRVAAPARAMPATASAGGGGMMMGGVAPARASRAGSFDSAVGSTPAPAVGGAGLSAGSVRRGAGNAGFGPAGRPAAPGPSWGAAPPAAPAAGQPPSWGAPMRTAPATAPGWGQAGNSGLSGGSRFSAPARPWGSSVGSAPSQAAPAFRSAPAPAFRSAPAPAFRSAPAPSSGGMRFAPSSGSSSSGSFGGAVRGGARGGGSLRGGGWR